MFDDWNDGRHVTTACIHWQAALPSEAVPGGIGVFTSRLAPDPTGARSVRSQLFDAIARALPQGAEVGALSLDGLWDWLTSFDPQHQANIVVVHHTKMWLQYAPDAVMDVVDLWLQAAEAARLELRPLHLILLH